MKIKQHLVFTFSAILISLLSNNYSAQVGGVNLRLDPTKNSGYTLWEPIPNATYRVKILERSGTGLNTISSFTTTDNFAHFTPSIFLIPNILYQIDAEDGHGMVIATTGPKEPNIIEGLGSATGCAIMCNGTSYAYSIQEQFPILGYNSQGPILGNRILKVGGAAQIDDPANAVYVPYWQAINSYSWNQIANNTTHPYNTSLHTSVPIPAGSSYLDAQNNAVTSGVLVSKGLDQYENFFWIPTIETGSYGTSLCTFSSANINGDVTAVEFYSAMEYYNDFHIPTSPNPYAYFTQASNLGCILSYDDSWWTAEPQEEDTLDNTVDDWILQDFYAELDDFLNGGGGIHKPGGVLVTDWKQLNDEFRVLENVDGTHGIRIKQVRLSSILNDEVTVVYDFDEEHGLELTSIEGDLNKGLYQMTIFTSETSIVIPSVLEIASDLPTPQDRDFFELTIAPNPIVNNELSYVVVGSKATNVTAIVFNLNGVVIQTQSITMSPTNSRFLGTVDLTGVAAPYNQIKVSLIFQDGSLIQKTALKL